MTQPVYFRASWTSSNAYLNPAPPCNLLIRIARIVKDILLFIPRWIALCISKKIFYPAANLPAQSQQTANRLFQAFWKAQPSASAAYQSCPNLLTQGVSQDSHPYGLWAPYEQDVCKAIQNTYQAQEFTLEAPDKTLLKGHYLKHARSHEPNARVLLVFGGNGDLYLNGGTCAPLLNILHDHPTPYSFLLMSPRGVGASSGSIHPQGLVMDGESLYQYAQSLGYPEKRIDLYGHSMGGAVAAEVKSLHPKTGGVTILDRTFSTLNAISMAHAKEMMFSPVRCANWFCNTSGWNFNNVKRTQSIQDPVYIYNHENEYMMRHNVDLLSACRSSPQANVHLTELSSIKPSLALPFPNKFHFLLSSALSDPHMDPLPLCYRKGEPLSPTDAHQNLHALCISSLLQGPFS